MSDRPYTYADVEWLAELLTGHHQTRGMAVTMGVTCDCGYWTGSEPLDQPRGHRPLPWGRDRLDLHRARAVLDALTAAGWAPRDTNSRAFRADELTRKIERAEQVEAERDAARAELAELLGADMSDYYDTYNYTCPHCGEPAQVVEGLEIGHGCPPAPAVEVSGCAPPPVGEPDVRRCGATTTTRSEYGASPAHRPADADVAAAGPRAVHRRGLA